MSVRIIFLFVCIIIVFVGGCSNDKSKATEQLKESQSIKSHSETTPILKNEQEPTQESTQEPTQEPEQDYVQETAEVATQEPGKEAMHDDPLSEVESDTANSTSNILNGGFADRSREYIFFSNLADNGFLYRMKLDGTEKVKLSKDIKSSDIHVMDDWVYYRSTVPDGLFKIRFDGTQKHLIKPGMFFNLNFEKDWIYYLDMTYQVHKMRWDGSDEQLVSDAEELLSLSVQNGLLVYDSLMDIGTFSVTLDKLETRKVTDEIQVFGLSDGWIYYRNGSDEDKMYRVHTDGTDNQKISDDIPNLLCNVSGGWVYYGLREDPGFFKVKIDGTEKVKLSDDRPYYLHVLGDMILYKDLNLTEDTDSEENLILMKTDGSGRKQIE
ncbi:DUF5050 domain-containing protein [Paenibacillus sp. LHD-117]|uniref:DUF5050 domain-containing protein n=1 Tax=Paenibacillus sp. LHD-117 TaxID=3071412 RepID=UPI0027E1C7F7|nr:DUF5050 domain-containing protein [Paenibacillus sp. LHD-117]MDQ6419088.1 DUF5050 domain-containing protein [Paenibacillus sp. LHD-117]